MMFWLSTDARTGWAPHRWQCDVGSVLLYRSDGRDFDAFEFCVAFDYVATALDRSACICCTSSSR